MHPDLVQATNEFDAVSNDLGETNRLVPAGEKRMVLEYGQDLTPANRWNGLPTPSCVWHPAEVGC